MKSRKSTKPLLLTLCDIVNYALQDICGQQDMEFRFEGLRDDEDKAAIVSLGVEKVQNGIASIDEVREDLDLPPWGLPGDQRAGRVHRAGADPVLAWPRS